MSLNVVIPEHALPDWMKRARRGVDWGVLLAMLLSLLVAWPFLHYESLPRTNDTYAYVFQASDVAAALQEGRLYPRWSPHVQAGAGAPIPNYYPPAPAYIVGFVDQLITNSPTTALRLTYALLYLLAGTMMYVLGKQLVNAHAGLFATALYLYNPYVALTLPHILGDLTSIIIVALLPTLLWATHRLATTTYPSNALYLSLAITALILTDPRYALIGGGLSLVGWLAFTTQRSQHNALGTFGMCWLLGMGMSSFYWLPALAEQPMVRWIESSVPAAPVRVVLESLFYRGHALDPTAYTHAAQFSMGIALPISAILSLPLLGLLQQRRIHLAFAITGALLVGVQVVLMPAYPLLLAPILLCFALSATGLYQLIQQWRWHKRQLLVTCFALGGIFYAALPVLSHTETRFPLIYYQPIDQFKHEQQGLGAALLPAGWDLPTTLPTTSPVSRSEASPNRNRLVSSRGAGTRIFTEYEGSHQHRYRIEINVPTELIFRRAHFPYWQVRLNDRPVSYSVDPLTGYLRISFDHAVQGTLSFTIGSTSIRTLSWIMSLSALGVSLGLARRRWRTYDDSILQDNSILLAPHHLPFLAALMLVMSGAIWAHLNTNLMDAWRAMPQQDLAGAITTLRTSDAGITLIGYKRPNQVYAPGEDLSVTLFWRADHTISTIYQTRISVQQLGTGTLWYQTELRHPGFFPTTRWVRDGYVADHYELRLPSTMTDGFYTVDVQMVACAAIPCEAPTPVTFNGPDGKPGGDAISIIQPLIIRQ